MKRFLTNITSRRGFVSIGIALLIGSFKLLAVDVLTQRGDKFRSSLNLAETNLTPALIKNPGAFHKLYFRTLDANAYAQPLYVSDLEIRGKKRNVIFVATENNTVYAFEDDPGERDPDQAPLWKSHLGPSIPTEQLSEDIGDGPSGCGDLSTVVGITSTPVIDRAMNVLYVVAKTKSSQGYAHTLHALDLRTGQMLRKTVIQGSAAGKGIASDSGRIVFQPAIQLNRPALLLDHNRIYIAFASHCDVGNFHGWLFAYDAADFKMIDAFITTPNTVGKYNGQGGIWQSGTGPAADDAGNIYVSVANGGYDPGLGDFGDSVLKLQLREGKFSVDGWFTPTNQEVLKIQDADLGSGGPLLVAGTQLLVTVGKEGKLYLLNHAEMKGNTPEVQEVQVTPGPHYFGPATNYGSVRYWNIHGTPVHFQTATGGFLYVCGEEDPIRAYRLTSTDSNGIAHLDPAYAVATSDERAAFPSERSRLSQSPVPNPNVWMPGGFLAISSNSREPDTAILWALMPLNGNANSRVVRGVLRAFDPVNFVPRSDGSLRIPQFWSSDHDNDSSSDSLGMYPKYVCPTIANGHVVVPTFREEVVGTNGIHTVKPGGLQPTLTVYGLAAPQ